MNYNKKQKQKLMIIWRERKREMMDDGILVCFLRTLLSHADQPQYNGATHGFLGFQNV
jgi:hypothetical protein